MFWLIWLEKEMELQANWIEVYHCSFAHAANSVVIQSSSQQRRQPMSELWKTDSVTSKRQGKIWNKRTLIYKCPCLLRNSINRVKNVLKKKL